MKKTFFLALFCLTTIGRAFAQNQSDSLIKKAIYLYQQNSYDSSLILFKQAIEKDSDNIKNTVYFYAACNAAKCNNKDLAFNWLLQYGNLTEEPQTNVVLLQTSLESLFDDKRWTSFIIFLKQKEYKKDSSLHYDIPLKKQLDTLYYDDQKYRIFLNEYIDKYGDSSQIVNNLWNKILYQDSINLNKLEIIFNKYGWVSKKRVGASAVAAQWMIIQHADLKIQKKHLPLLREAAENGDILKSKLALTIDRINIGDGQKQIYGSQIGTTTKNGKVIKYIEPIENPENVDKRRAEMNMEPIADYAKRNSIEWSLEKYKKDN